MTRTCCCTWLNTLCGFIASFGSSRFRLFLYVGHAPIRMDGSWPDFPFRCTMIDIRDVDDRMFLQSSQIEDNLRAILGRLQNQVDTVKWILQRNPGCVSFRFLNWTAWLFECWTLRALRICFQVISGWRSAD